MVLRDLCNMDFLYADSNDAVVHIAERLAHSSAAFVLVVENMKLNQIISADELLRSYTACLDPNRRLCELDEPESFIPLPCDTPLKSLADSYTGRIAAMDGDDIVGVLDYIPALKNLLPYSSDNKLDMPFQGFQQVFEHLEEEIIVTNGKGIICYLNPKAESLLSGIPKKEVIGMNIRDLVDKKIFYPSAALEALKTRKKVDIHTHLKNGQTLLSTAIPIFAGDGSIQYTVCTSKNIKEILELNQKLQMEKQKLEQKNLEIARMQKKEFEQMDFYFDSDEMYKVMMSIKRVAPLDMTVLIQGETGVGKEIIAKSIHYLSNRKLQPFVKINCGLIPENLIESELFGYEPGAFTGASKSGKKGKVEMADGGTLFLDEIGDMMLNMQIKLLDFLQDSSFVRVGGTKRLKADVRVVSATNRDLEKMVKEGKFRMDLFYRLNVFNIKIPPLRERINDIPVLTEYFIKKFNTKYGINRRLAPEVIHSMYYYSWPGNVRELEHTIERIIVMSDSDIISESTLMEVLDSHQKPSLRVICNGIIPYKEAKNELEKTLVFRAYEMYHSTYKAAQALGIDQSTVSKLMKKHRADSDTDPS